MLSYFGVYRMWVVHALGVCALLVSINCRSVVPTAQGTGSWEDLSQIQGLKTRPALPLQKEAKIKNDETLKKTSPALKDDAMQQNKMFVGSDNDKALDVLGEMLTATDEYEDETSGEGEGLDVTDLVEHAALDGFCVVRFIFFVLMI